MEEKLSKDVAPGAGRDSRFQTKSVLSKIIPAVPAGSCKFPAAERLKSRYHISGLIQKGKTVSQDGFTLFYYPTSLPLPVPVQLLLLAPKRVFRAAPERNYQKRILREIWRKNRQPLLDILLQQQEQYAIGLLSKNKTASFAQAEKTIIYLLAKCAERLRKVKP
jgi:ribonuclease P protein component